MRFAADRAAVRIEAIVYARHLGVGYSGYWEAASLARTTNDRLPVYPVSDLLGPLAPAYDDIADYFHAPVG